MAQHRDHGRRLTLTEIGASIPAISSDLGLNGDNPTWEARHAHAVATTGTVSGSAVEPGRNRRPGAASPCHRGGHLGYARGQLRTDASSDGQARRVGEPGRVLVAARQLEEPDAHAQPRHHLLHAVLQHQGRRTGRAGDTACRHRHDRRLDRRLLADGDRGRRASGRRQGAGARYLILPPDHAARFPTDTSRCPSPTYKSYALLRSNYRSAADADIAEAVAYGKRVRVYPLSAAADPPQTTYIDANDTLFDATIPYDVRFFDALNGIVQTEPWLAATRR